MRTELLYGHQKPLHQFTSSVIRQCLDAAGVSNEGAGELLPLVTALTPLS